MIIIEDEEIVGWESAIIGMRNPMNSWDKSDSWYGCGSEFDDHLEPEDCDMDNCKNCHFCIGKNDLDLMKRLAKAGTDHRKFMRMIVVYVDVTSPLYWWKEFDTYKVGTVRNSCSTMHKITEKEFTLDDFSHEHLSDDSIKLLKDIVFILNIHREKYITFKELWEKSEKIANYIKKNCKKKAPVLIYGNKDINIIPVMIASLKTGRAYCPVDITYPPERLYKISKITNCEIIFNFSELDLETSLKVVDSNETENIY